MKRNLEPVDSMVVVGVFATLLGGALLFMATSGPFQTPTPEAASVNRSPDIMTAMQWVQPALGQGIVDDYLLRSKASEEMAGAAMTLNRSVMSASRLPAFPFESRERAARWAVSMESDHDARVQFVLGRLIADYTARGVRTGVLSPTEPAGDYNNRMMQIAEAAERRMQEAFRSHRQEDLGRTIVSASQWHNELASRIQERVGNAIVHVAMVQDGYQKASERMRAQLAAIGLAAMRTEQQADLFARLGRADLAERGEMASLAPNGEPRSWPEVPFALWFAASVVLMGAFCAGFFMPSRREPVAVSEMEMKSGEKGYRKTA